MDTTKIFSKALEICAPEASPRFDCSNYGSEKLTEFRIRLSYEVFKNLCKFNHGNLEDILLHEDGLVIRNVPLRIGPVLDPSTGKKDVHTTMEEYYMKRVSQLEDSQSDLPRKGTTTEVARCVTFYDFLNCNLKKPAIAMGLRDDEGSNSLIKRASSVLYNRARVYQILKKYQNEVDQGSLPELQALENTNLSKLMKAEELSILKKYIDPFPLLVSKSWSEGKRLEKVPADLWKFLVFLSQDFSVYYGKVRVLCEPAMLCLETLHARLWLLKTLLNIYDSVLHILNITPLDVI